MASSSTHFVQLCQGTTVIDGGSGSGSHGRGGSGSSTALDGGGYIDNRGGAHSSYDDHRHRLTVTTLVTTARARAAAVSCSVQRFCWGGRRCLAYGDLKKKKKKYFIMEKGAEWDGRVGASVVLVKTGFYARTRSLPNKELFGIKSSLASLKSAQIRSAVRSRIQHKTYYSNPIIIPRLFLPKLCAHLPFPFFSPSSPVPLTFLFIFQAV